MRFPSLSFATLVAALAITAITVDVFATANDISNDIVPETSFVEEFEDVPPVMLGKEIADKMAKDTDKPDENKEDEAKHQKIMAKCKCAKKCMGPDGENVDGCGDCAACVNKIWKDADDKMAKPDENKEDEAKHQKIMGFMAKCKCAKKCMGPDGENVDGCKDCADCVNDEMAKDKARLQIMAAAKKECTNMGECHKNDFSSAKPDPTSPCNRCVELEVKFAEMHVQAVVMWTAAGKEAAKECKKMGMGMCLEIEISSAKGREKSSSSPCYRCVVHVFPFFCNKMATDMAAKAKQMSTQNRAELENAMVLGCNLVQQGLGKH